MTTTKHEHIGVGDLIHVPKYVGLTPEQLEARKTRLGASDIGALMGVSPWRSREELAQKKSGHPEAPWSEHPRLFWGNCLEPSVARGIAQLTGWQIAEGREVPHPSADLEKLLVSTLDFVIVNGHDDFASPGVLELKNVTKRSFDSWPKGEPAPYYWWQVQAQLACTGWAFGVLGVLVDGWDCRLFTIPRDEEAIATLESEVVLFWEYIKKGEVPPPIPQPAGLPTKIASFDDEIVDDLEEYLHYTEHERITRKRKKEIKGRLLDAMHGAGVGIHELGYKVEVENLPSVTKVGIVTTKAGRSRFKVSLEDG